MYQPRSIVKLTIIAVSLSVLVHVAFIVFSFFKTMEWEPYESATMVRKVTPVDFMDIEDLPQEVQEVSQPKENEPVTNKSFNADDNRDFSEEKYDSRTEKQIEEQVEKELREFEAKEFAKYKKEEKKDIITNENSKEKINTDQESSEKKTSSGSLKGSVTAMYELTQRRDEKLAIPAYICKGSGTVKVNIVVDREGLVILATIDKKGSSYKETCIGENALAYAKKCRFSISTVAPEQQNGWILYTFIAQ